MNKLQVFFDIHIQWLKENIHSVPPGEDIMPLLSMSSRSTPLIMLPFPDSDDTRAWAKDRLQEVEADYYAAVTAAWTVDLNHLSPDEARRVSAHVAEHGTKGLDRQECYIVSAGSRDTALVAVFIVKRDETGKITSLTRQQEVEGGVWAGSMCDLLMRAH